jgi:hypothetical protein
MRPCTVERRLNTTAAHERVETTPPDSNQYHETALATSDAHQDRPVRGELPTVVATTLSPRAPTDCSPVRDIIIY